VGLAEERCPRGTRRRRRHSHGAVTRIARGVTVPN
jgi:hypothetical protein